MQRIVNGELVDVPTDEMAAILAEQEAVRSAADWEMFQEHAKVALEESNGIVLRCFEDDIQVPPEWVAYRKNLRAIIGSKSGDAATGLPSRPTDPEWT